MVFIPIRLSNIEMFEGLGLGSRLASLTLSPRFSWVPYVASFFYSAMTPLGIAIGLGVRTTYNPDSTTASIVSGTLDSLSAGVLLYTGLVELLAHEFLFNPRMRQASTGRVVYGCSCMILGAGIMALLGRWA
jgi:zinc transporter 1/2/3